MTLPFGKFRGEPLALIPLGYLGWCLEEARNLDDDLRDALQAEVRRRIGVDDTPTWPVIVPPDPTVAEAARALLSAGYRLLARKAHPDAGGSHHEMVALGAARDWLADAVQRGVVA